MLTKKEMEKIKRERARARKKRREVERYKWEREEERLAEEENTTGDVFIPVFVLSGFLIGMLHNLMKYGHI